MSSEFEDFPSGNFEFVVSTLFGLVPILIAIFASWRIYRSIVRCKEPETLSRIPQDKVRAPDSSSIEF